MAFRTNFSFFRTFFRQNLVLAGLFYDFQDKFYLLQNLPQAVIWPERPPGLLSGQILPCLQPFTNKNLASCSLKKYSWPNLDLVNINISCKAAQDALRQANGLPTASFRFRLAADTLAVQLCTSSLPRRTRDFHPLERAHGAHTKKKAAA